MHCTCAECGYQWLRGQHGGHSCAENLKKEVAKLKLEMAELEEKAKLAICYESITPYFSKLITERKYQKLKPEYQKWYRPLGRFYIITQPVVSLPKPTSALDFIMPVAVYAESQVIEILEKNNIKVNKYK
jgi:hypothetical protein